jgi:hypothetical protein
MLKMNSQAKSSDHGDTAFYTKSLNTSIGLSQEFLRHKMSKTP